MRWLFLATMIPSCLWIGSAEHDERKRSVDPELTILDITPDTWSACSGLPRFTVVGTVAERHAGRMFETFVIAEGTRTPMGDVSAGTDGSMVFDVTPGDLAPNCADSCPIAFTVGVSHLAFDDQADVTATILGETDPVFAQVSLVDPDGGAIDLAAFPLAENPFSSASTSQYPTLAVGLTDPYLHDPGSELVVQVVMCPNGQAPDATACIRVDAVPSEIELVGDAVYEVPTEAFAAAACAEGQRDWLWHPYAVLDGHPCATDGVVDLGTDLRLVVDDCDEDLWTVDDGDCDDDDPERNPDAVEIWYDGFDQDCDAADDYDRDGDGVMGGPTGTDCDDDDPATYPGAPEICDSSDNDCDGTTLVDIVTVEPVGGGPAEEFTGLDAALSSSGSGDVVRICPGSFTGTFTVTTDLTIIGSGPGSTYLFPAASDQPVLEVIGSLSAHIEGVELSGASDTQGTLRGGGLRALDSDDLTLQNVRSTGNAAAEGGGMLLGGVAHLIDVEIVNNTASDKAGGLFVGLNASVDAVGLLVNGNSAANGGGVTIVDRGQLTLDASSLISGNTATLGGGVLLEDDATLVGGDIAANDAVDGGGVYARENTDAVAQAEIEGTLIRDHVGIERGGGIFAVSDDIEVYLTDVVIQNNSVTADGGGVYVLSDGVFASWLITDQLTVIGNSAVGDGGGIYLENNVPYLLGGLIDDNSAFRGGGLFGQFLLGSFETTFSNNVATGDGGGFYMVTGDIYNYGPTEMSGNSAVRGGAGYLDDLWYVGPDMVMTGNTATGSGGGLFLTNYGHSGMYYAGTVSGNISGDGQSNGVYVDADALSYVSCATMSNSDTVASASEPVAGVPSNNCFTVYPTGLDDGQCDICP